MLLSIDERDPRAAYLQIASGIKEQVRAGLLEPGDELPSVRELASDLGINLHTARHAYQILSQQKIIHLRLGRRAKIAPLRDKPAAREEIESRLSGRMDELMTDAFHLGLSADQVRAMVEKAIRQKK